MRQPQLSRSGTTLHRTRFQQTRFQQRPGAPRSPPGSALQVHLLCKPNESLGEPQELFTKHPVRAGHQPALLPSLSSLSLKGTHSLPASSHDAPGILQDPLAFG